MSTIDLTRLDADEFDDELRESLFEQEMWEPFTADDVVDRTRAGLISFANFLQSQLAAREDEGDREWERRVRNLLRRVQSRIAEVNVAIRDRNKRQTATVETVSKKWSTLALQLAEALDDSNMAFLLDDIDVGGITARVWLRKRRAMTALKGEMAS